MTHPTNRTPRIDASRQLLAAIALGAFALLGCKKESPSHMSQAPVVSSAPVARAPSNRRLGPADLGLVEGVEFPAELIPDDQTAALAAASLANAIKSGDADALRPMLDPADAAVLDQLVKTGAWGDAAAATKIVRISSIEPAGDTVRIGLALEDDQGAYLLGWQGKQERGAWLFAALPVKSQVASRASDLDGAPLEEMNIPVAGPVAKEAQAKRPPVDKNKRGGKKQRRSGRPGGIGN